MRWVTRSHRSPRRTGRRARALLKAGAFKADAIAKRLGIATFDKEESLSEKLGLPSSVLVTNHNDNTGRVIVQAKEGLDLESAEFLAFSGDACKAVPG